MSSPGWFWFDCYCSRLSLLGHPCISLLRTTREDLSEDRAVLVGMDPTTSMIKVTPESNLNKVDKWG